MAVSNVTRRVYVPFRLDIVVLSGGHTFVLLATVDREPSS